MIGKMHRWLFLVAALAVLLVADPVYASPNFRRIDSESGAYTYVEVEVSGTLSNGLLYYTNAVIRSGVISDLSALDPSKDWGLVVDWVLVYTDTGGYRYTISPEVPFFDSTIDKKREGVTIDLSSLLPSVLRQIRLQAVAGYGYVEGGYLYYAYDTAWASVSFPKL